MRMKNHVHIKGRALNLVLIQMAEMAKKIGQIKSGKKSDKIVGQKSWTKNRTKKSNKTLDKKSGKESNKKWDKEIE